VIGSIALLATRQLNWGLDFTGGTLVEVHYSELAPLEGIRKTLEAKGFSGALAVSFGSDRDVLIRLPQGYSDKDGARLLEQLQSIAPD
jgi:preprotein translocase subunit SecF